MGRIRVGYRAAREEYSRCRALGIPGRVFRAVAREYEITLVLFCRFINREHQEGLDSTDADECSSDEYFSMGDF